MTEAEHIKAVVEHAAALARASAREETVRSKRDRAIRSALEVGVSDRALAIAANVGRQMIGYVARDPEHKAEQPAPSLGIHAINAVYPCCGVEARFQRDEAIDPSAEHIKKCPSCERMWTVNRTVLASTGRGRVDELHWTMAVTMSPT